MTLTAFGIKMIVLFFPGVLCYLIVERLTVHPPRKPFDMLLYSFVFGLSSYLAYWVILRGVNVFRTEPIRVAFLAALADEKADLYYPEILLVCAVAAMLALALTCLSTYKLLHRVAHRLGITRKFADLGVWGYAFNMKEVGYATVRDIRNDLVYDGWVGAYSDDLESAEVLLRDVSVYRNSIRRALYQVGAVYLCLDKHSIQIEFRGIPVAPDRQWKEGEGDG